MKFNRSVLEQLRGKTPAEPFTGEVIVELELYQKGRLRQDIDNAISSCLDVLMDAGVIADDDQVVELHVFKHRGASEWKNEIHLVSVQ